MVFIMINMDDLKELMLDTFKEGKTFTFPAKGKSMKPFINDSDVVTLRKVDKIKKGDVIYFKRELGGYVLHRVIKIKKDGLIMCGDHQTRCEKIKEDQVLAILDGVERKGKEKNLNSKKYRFYKFFIRFRIVRFIFKVIY